MRARGEQPFDVRQAAGAVDRMQRFEVLLSHGQGDIDAGEGGEQLLDGVALRKGHVGGKSEDRLAKVGPGSPPGPPAASRARCRG